MFINAGQAMPSGGSLTIKTRMIREENEIQVTVRDSGSGIDEENLKRIFDPFFSTKSQKGFGLGLSVSYGIIRNHGGRVDVESEVGQGTCFTVHLPVEPNQLLPFKDDGDDGEVPPAG